MDGHFLHRLERRSFVARVIWVTATSVTASVGCVSTQSSVREVAAPDVRVEHVPLPETRELEAEVRRDAGKLRLLLTESQRCRRLERTTVHRERVDRSRISSGTGITAGILGSIGLLEGVSGESSGSTPALLLGTSAAILAIAAARTGTTTTLLEPRETLAPTTLERCGHRPVPGTAVALVSAGIEHEGVTDASGELELEDVAEGPLRIVVARRSVKVRETSSARSPSVKPPAPAESPAPPPKSPEAPVSPTALPPPPPPPPGATLPSP